MKSLSDVGQGFDDDCQHQEQNFRKITVSDFPCFRDILFYAVVCFLQRRRVAAEIFSGQGTSLFLYSARTKYIYSMKKVISLGEIMLRLSPANDLRFLQTECLDAVFGGSEANVAVALSQLGQPAAFVTKLPDNVVGEMALQVLRRYGVDTSTVIRGGKRLGIYFLEKGFSSCSSICTYDRAHSAIAEAKPEEFDWKRIFEEAGWFHFSGITPALSDEAAEICLQACRTARKLGIGVSCDVNYRSKLWSMDKAREVMSEIGRYVDVAIVNEEEAAVLGADIRVDEAMNAEVYAQMAEQLNKKFDFGKIASVARVPSENGLAVQGMLWDRSGICCSRRYPLESIVDPLGAGDAFAAALLYCFLKTEIAENQETVEFASAACALKHRIKGDYLLVKPADVLALTDNVRGRVCGVQR